MTTSFRVAELDFDTIKNNLKDYFRTDPTFTDYDFEGSGLSIILDILAYNTHYNAVIANMLTQEMFLETATKRESVSLHAKKLGYLPRSIRSARANVSIEVFPTNNPDTITLGKSANFTSGGEIQFNFTNLNSITTTRDSNGRYIFPDVPLYEGTLETFRYVVSTQKRFEIPSKNADISLLKVFVQQSTSSTDIIEYFRYDSIVDIADDTTAYFIQINENGYYEIYFGDDVIGKSIQAGNMVTLEYVICNGEIPNGAGSFSITDSINGYSNIATTTTSKAFGGAQQENISSIKENAYKRLLTQNRAVSYTDFKPIVQQILPVGDVVVWGGENNTPPVYGKVFISAISTSNPSKILSAAEKQYLISELRKKMLVTVTPEVIDPDFLNVEISSAVYYDQLKTSNSASQIMTMVMNSISGYAATKLNMFQTELRHSNLGTLIDATDRSINSNITKYVLKKDLSPVFNRATNYQINFKNPLRQSSEVETTIRSNGFYADGNSDIVYMDDYAGIIRLYKIVDGVNTYLKNVGTVNYQTGVITINELLINSTVETTLTFKCLPLSNDIVCNGNTVLIVSESDISINVISESSLFSHTFTASV